MLKREWKIYWYSLPIYRWYGLFFIFITLISISFYVGIYRPIESAENWYRQESFTLEKQKNDIAKIKEDVTNLKKILQQFDTKQISEKNKSNAEYDEYMYQLVNLIQQSKNHLRHINNKIVQTKFGSKVYELSTDFSGTLKSIENFLNTLGEYMDIAKIKRLTLQQNNEKEWSAQLSISILLNQSAVKK
jgi:hypothetical protein